MVAACCLLLAEHCLLQLQEERNAKGELKQLLAGAVQSERAAEKKLADVSAELETVKSRMAKAEAALQVGSLFLVSPPLPMWSFHNPHILTQARHTDDIGECYREEVRMFGRFISIGGILYIAAVRESAMSTPSLLVCKHTLKSGVWMIQAERAEHDELAVGMKALEARHASKSELCKKLEERRLAKAELAKQLAAEVEGLKQERNGLSTQLSALQEAHER